MPASKIPTDFFGWLIPGKALTVFELYDWYQEFEDMMNGADADTKLNRIRATFKSDTTPVTLTDKNSNSVIYNGTLATQTYEVPTITADNIGMHFLVESDNALKAILLQRSGAADEFYFDGSSVGTSYSVENERIVIEAYAIGQWNIIKSGNVSIENVTWPNQGSPAHGDDAYDLLNHHLSTSVLDGFDITKNIDGTVDVAAGAASLRSADDVDSPLVSYSVSGVTNQALADNSVNHVCVDYDSGTPAIIVTTDLTTGNIRDRYCLWSVTRVGADLHVVDFRRLTVDVDAGITKRFTVNGLFDHRLGAAISETGTRNFAISAGTFYVGADGQSTTAFDSAVAGTFTQIYRDGGGGWTRTTGHTQINNTQYDNGTGSLATLANNKFGIHWIYIVKNVPDLIFVMIGQDEYDSLAEAQAATVPTALPPEFNIYGSGILTGKIMIEKDAPTYADIQSAFESNALYSSNPTTHNDLAGLQGGTASEYFHLTSDEHGNIPAVINSLDATRDPTGFKDPENVIVTYDTGARTVTLTGTIEAYWRGVSVTALTSGWVSTAHPAAPTLTQFLYYNGSAFVWSTSPWEFYMLQICVVMFDSAGTFIAALRETHGLQGWESHRADHYTSGTYRLSGGDVTGFTFNSTTAANRRPQTSQALIYDEDLPSTVLSHTTQNNYSQIYRTGASGDLNKVTGAADIVPTSGTSAQYNEWTGSTWQLTNLGNNEYTSIWEVLVPVTADATSQLMRSMWIPGQFAQSGGGGLQANRTLTPGDLELGELASIAPEYIFVQQVIIQETGAGDWEVIDSIRLTGTRVNQIASPSGDYLTSVSSDATLTGDGTAADPLSVVSGTTQTLQTVYDAGNVVNVGALPFQLNLSANNEKFYVGGLDSKYFEVKQVSDETPILEVNSNAIFNLGYVNAETLQLDDDTADGSYALLSVPGHQFNFRVRGSSHSDYSKISADITGIDLYSKKTIELYDQWLTSTNKVTLSESGVTALDTTSQSLVGAINEVNAAAGGGSVPKSDDFVATSSQTNFTLSFTPAAAWVWLNGAAQDSDSWSISGDDIVLSEGADTGDTVSVYYLTLASVLPTDIVTKVGTPVNNQVGVWTGDGTLEGDTGLTFDGSTLTVDHLVIGKTVSSSTWPTVTATGGTATVAFDEYLNATVDLDDNATVTITINEANGPAKFGLILKQGSTTPTTTINWVTEGTHALRAPGGVIGFTTTVNGETFIGFAYNGATWYASPSEDMEEVIPS